MNAYKNLVLQTNTVSTPEEAICAGVGLGMCMAQMVSVWIKMNAIKGCAKVSDTKL